MPFSLREKGIRGPDEGPAGTTPGSYWTTALNAELPQTGLQLPGQTIQHPPTVRSGRHRLGRALGFGMNHLDPPAHRIGPLSLMGRRRSRRIDRAMHLFHRCLHRVLHLGAFAQCRQAKIRLLPGLGNGPDRLMRALLQGSDMRLNIAGGLLGLARQGPHLIGHYGKAAPVFARAPRFNRSIKGK